MSETDPDHNPDVIEQEQPTHHQSGAVKASRIVCIVACLATLGVMIAALGPFGQHEESGGMLLSLIMLPLVAIWAVGPYVIANKFARESEGATAWVYVLLQVITGLAVLVLYVDAFIITPEQGLNPLVVFVILPLYQFMALLVAYYGIRLWRRFYPPL